MFWKFSAIFMFVFLVGCQSAAKLENQNSDFHIVAVEVRLPNEPDKHKALKHTESFNATLVNVIRRYSAEYNATRRHAKNAYKLKLDVAQVRFKNPVASLLVGDANRITAVAVIIDTRTGETIHNVPINYIDAASGALNGIVGAVLSVAVKKEAAEATMARGMAADLMRLLYPDTKLPPSAAERLKGKVAFEPMTQAISPLASGAVETTPQPQIAALQPVALASIH